MSLAEYRAQLRHQFVTEDTQALDPGASNGKAGQREQRPPALEAGIKEKQIQTERPSSASSSIASTSSGNISVASESAVVAVHRPPEPVSILKGENTSKISRRPSKGFVDVVEHRGRVQDTPIFYLTDEFWQLKNASGAARPPGGKDRWDFGDYAVVFRRIYKDFILTTGRTEQLEIHSEPLCIRLRQIAAQSHKDENLEHFPIVLRGPFPELFFHRAEIEALANDESIDPDLRRDAQALDEFVHLPNGLLAWIIEDYERFEKEGRIISDILWTLYRPSSLLVYDTGLIKECYICQQVSQRSGQRCVVTGLRIGFDGKSPVLTRQSFTLHTQKSELIDIAKLTLRPFHAYSTWVELKSLLKKRSENITTDLGTNFRSFACRDYSGAAWGGYDNDLIDDGSPTQLITERVIVDATQFPYRSVHFPSTNVAYIKRSSKSMAENSGQERRSESLDYGSEASQDDVLNTTTYDRAGDTPKISFHSQDKVDYRSIDGLAEAAASRFNITVKEFGLLFPALVPAFGLSSRKWWWVLSDRLQDVEWNKAAFEFLQHNQDTKHLVQTLIKGYKRMSAVSNDVFTGQRHGLAFLLHGGSGLGKRYTAETIAEYLERPLHSISTSGLIDADVGVRLGRFLHQAERWNAVALLEEADVLFGKSDSGDLATKLFTRRVFMKELKNFQGVLIFKTSTNKDLTKDIKSLIHLTIRYPALSSDAQARIWENLIKDIKTPTDQTWNEAVYGELGKLILNGHMIKSFLKTAVAFANAEEKSLGARHVLTILRTELSAEDFEEDKEKWEKQVQPALQRLHKMLDIPFQQGSDSTSTGDGEPTLAGFSGGEE